MGYFGKLKERAIAQKLRKKGWSYGKIRTKVRVSKDTISRWCRDIPLTKIQQQQLINNKKFGQKKGSIVAAKNKRKERIRRTKEIFLKAHKEIGEISKRDRFLAGIALYAAEGDKGDRYCAFTNSDPRMIRFMARWFRKFLKVPESKFRGAIWIHEGLNVSLAKKFWSNLAKIPENQFHKTYVAKAKKNSRKIRKNIHQYGVFSLRFSDLSKQRRMIGWTSTLLGGKINLKS